MLEDPEITPVSEVVEIITLDDEDFNENVVGHVIEIPLTEPAVKSISSLETAPYLKQPRTQLKCVLRNYCKHVETPKRRCYTINSTWIPIIQKALGDQYIPKAWHQICNIHFDECDFIILTKSYIRPGAIPKHYLTPPPESNPKVISSHSQFPVNSNSKENQIHGAKKRKITSPSKSLDQPSFVDSSPQENPDSQDFHDDDDQLDSNLNDDNDKTITNLNQNSNSNTTLKAQLRSCKKQLKDKDVEIKKLQSRVEKLEATMNVMLEFLTECKDNDWISPINS